MTQDKTNTKVQSRSKSSRMQSCINGMRNHPGRGAAREGRRASWDLKGGVVGLQREGEVLLRELEHPQVQRPAPPLELLHRLHFGVHRRLPCPTHPPAPAPRRTPPPRSSLRHGRDADGRERLEGTLLRLWRPLSLRDRVHTRQTGLVGWLRGGGGYIYTRRILLAKCRPFSPPLCAILEERQ